MNTTVTEEPGPRAVDSVGELAGEPAAPGPPSALSEEILGAGDLHLGLKLQIHDVSRFEWAVPLPLPSHQKFTYRIEVEFEVPANAVTWQNPWEHLQILSRLEGSSDVLLSAEPTIDEVRRGAVALTGMMKRARAGFVRHCQEVRDFVPAPGIDRNLFLGAWLEAAVRAVRDARRRLTTTRPQESALIVRERALVNEFVSVRVLDFLAQAQQLVTEQYAWITPGDELHVAFAKVEERIQAALKAEFEYRTQNNFENPSIAAAGMPDNLEIHVARAARLKKHFEEVLFLDRETYMADERVQNWVAAFAAVLAGGLAFLLQPLLLNASPDDARLGSGLALLTFFAGVAYAARDRIKEAGRAWLTGKVYRFHAQRVSMCRLPARHSSVQPIVVRAKEWFNMETRTKPDALNPEAGASLRTTKALYVHRGIILPQAPLKATGVRGVVHVFRYDLSPLFPRLHDDVKTIPALGNDGRIELVRAPRRYHVPVRLTVTAEGGYAAEMRAMIVLDKRGLRRVDPVTSRTTVDGLDVSAPASEPEPEPAVRAGLPSERR